MTPVWVPRYRLTPAMARALMEVGASAAVVEHLAIPPAVREELRRRARVRSTHYSLGLFAMHERITAHHVAAALGLSERTARLLLRKWVDDGWLEVADSARRTRAYSLSAIYRQFIGNPSAIHRPCSPRPVVPR